MEAFPAARPSRPLQPRRCERAQRKLRLRCALHRLRHGLEVRGGIPAAAPRRPAGSAKDNGPSSPRPVCTINGTSRNDVLTGSSRDDIICGYGGNDRIDGRDGADIVLAGPGKDVISARDHVVDQIDGGPGQDSGKFDRSPRDRVSGVEHPSFG